MTRLLVLAILLAPAWAQVGDTEWHNDVDAFIWANEKRFNATDNRLSRMEGQLDWIEKIVEAVGIGILALIAKEAIIRRKS